MNLLNIIKTLWNGNRFDDSFGGPFIECMEMKSAVFSAPHNSNWTGRLDCPRIKVARTYRWSIQIENAGTSCFPCLGIASSCHELDFQKYLGSQNGGWDFDSGGYVTLKFDLSTNISNDVTSGGTLSEFIGSGKSNELMLVDDVIGAGHRRRNGLPLQYR